MRVGLGTDVHRLEEGHRLMLGGMCLPHEKGAVGHSDSDVVLHALTDAMLGALAQGDIGDLFPDSEPAYKDADSRTFVGEALARVHRSGYEVVNVDVVIQLERPKIGPVRAQIRRSVASILEIAEERVSIKAKTNEGLGAIGRGEAVACQTVVLLDNRSDNDAREIT